MFNKSASFCYLSNMPLSHCIKDIVSVMASLSLVVCDVYMKLLIDQIEDIKLKHCVTKKCIEVYQKSCTIKIKSVIKYQLVFVTTSKTGNVCLTWFSILI